MKAIGFKQSLPLSSPNSFELFEVPKPSPQKRELLVCIKAISVNPVDFKVRQSAVPKALTEPKIIGWDAAGVVEAVGSEVSLFKVGDEVYYAGDLNKQGCNAAYQVIDERIVGSKPSTLSMAEAAALPLTTLTAWELLFDRMRLDKIKDKGKTVLILGGAGGVGSIAIQIAKQILGLEVIATASRPETLSWCQKQGADYVVNHKNLSKELKKIGRPQVDFILDFVDVNAYWDSLVELIKPQGRIGSITGSAQPVVLNKLKSKSVSFSWELMFTRASFETEDMIDQHHILSTVATLLDKGTLRSTLNQTLKGLSTQNLKQAHEYLESGKSIGKVVLEY